MVIGVRTVEIRTSVSSSDLDGETLGRLKIPSQVIRKLTCGHQPRKVCPAQSRTCGILPCPTPYSCA